MTENDILLTDRKSAKLLHISVSTFQRHVTNKSLLKPLKFVFYRVSYNQILSMSSNKQNSNVKVTPHKKKTLSRKDRQGFSFSHEAYEVQNPSYDASNRIKNYVFFYECSGHYKNFAWDLA